MSTPGRLNLLPFISQTGWGWGGIRLISTAAAVIFLTGLVAACGGSDAPSTELKAVDFAQVPPTGQSQFVGRVGFYIARTQTEYQSLFDYTNSLRGPGEQLTLAPSIDFGQFLVLGVAMEPTTCDVVLFRRVKLSEVEMVAEYRYSRPRGAGCPASTYQPYQFIRVPFTTLPIRFVEVTE